MIYISIVLSEYVFMFQYAIVQDNPPFHIVVAILNFIVIQTQNIADINIFYEIYMYL